MLRNVRLSRKGALLDALFETGGLKFRLFWTIWLRCLTIFSVLANLAIVGKLVHCFTES
jgi:hypothetical protein